jgi:hypothetical protein
MVAADVCREEGTDLSDFRRVQCGVGFAYLPTQIFWSP